MTDETVHPIGVKPVEDTKVANVEQQGNPAGAQNEHGAPASELCQIRPLKREQAVVVKPPVLKLMK